jgi:DNA topoisomerase-2
MSKQIKVKGFFETQFKNYSIYDSQRSIASVIDGQKITMRKVLYTCSIKSNQEIKVSQLASSVAYETAYHHGDLGIGGVICNMAQDFAGANNVNFLEPLGQFGSRLCPTPAATRYIFTKLSPAFRQYFKKDDDLILEYNSEEGQQIEPKYFLPILPVILLNGSQGIGTGFASKILSYNPQDVKKDILNLLTNKKRTPLVPWFRGFNGSVKQGDNSNQWVITGKLEVLNTTTIKITELPIGTYPDDMKETLVKLKETDIIKDYDEDNDEVGFNYTITCPRTTTTLPIEKLYDLFKLVSKETENLTLWNANDKIQVFNNTSEIISYFVGFRIAKYEQRRLALIDKTEEEILALDEKIRFVDFYLNNTTLFKNTAKKELIDLLLNNSFLAPEQYLSMAIWNLTKDKIAELNNDLVVKLDYLTLLQNETAHNMYVAELNDLKL